MAKASSPRPGRRDLLGVDLTVFLTSASQTVGSLTLTIVNDDLFEGAVAETALATMGSVTGAIAAGQTTQQIAIADDDLQPTVQFTAATQVVSEAAGTTTVSVELDAVSGLDTVVEFTTSGTATRGADLAYSFATLSIPAGQQAATVTLTINDDSVDEPDESFTFTMASCAAATITGDTTHTVTIGDDDDAPQVSLSASAASLTEAGGSTVVTATLTAVSSYDVTVSLLVSGSAIGGGIDYLLSGTTITIPAGSLSETVTLASSDDALDGGDETVVLSMGTPTNTTPSGVTEQTVTITDNDGVPTVSFTQDTRLERESVGIVDLTVELSAASPADIEIPFTLTGTADIGSDYALDARAAEAAVDTYPGVDGATTVDDAPAATPGLDVAPPDGRSFDSASRLDTVGSAGADGLTRDTLFSLPDTPEAGPDSTCPAGAANAPAHSSISAMP